MKWTVNQCMKRVIEHINWFNGLILLKLYWNISNPSEVFRGKGVLKINSKFTGEHPCWSAISLKLLCNLIENALRHGCSQNTFRTPFPKNNSGGLLPMKYFQISSCISFSSSFIVFKPVTRYRIEISWGYY